LLDIYASFRRENEQNDSGPVTSEA
jgi:hypothetical protein